MIKKSFLLTFLLTSSLLFGFSAEAIGVGVKPRQIDLEVKTGREASTEFLVTNIGIEPAIYEVYADYFANRIKFEPVTFPLDPNDNQLVKVRVKSKIPGFFKTNISVIARPLGAGGIKTASGVKVPIVIHVLGIPVWWWILGCISICLIDIFTVFLIRRHKKPINNQ